MRILFVNHTGEWSGAEVSLMRLLETLGRRHEVVAACPSPGRLSDEIRRRGIEWLPIPATTASLQPHPLHTAEGVLQILRAGIRTRMVIARARPDVIHANGLRAGSIAAAAPLTSAPVLVQVHDVLPQSTIASAVKRVISGTADAISAVSDKATESFNQGLNNPRAFRIHISIDHSRFDPETLGDSSLRDELAIGDSPLLVQVAQITPWKGQHTAIQVVARLRQLNLAAHLVIVGGVSFASARYDNYAYERELHALVDRLGVQDAVHFVGHRSDVPEIMKTADLTLLPSTNEPFGTAALESMAVGTPAIVSADGGMSEFVDDGVNGRIIPPDQAGEWATVAGNLLSDGAALASMGEAARAAAALFTDEKYAGEMESAYLRLLATRDVHGVGGSNARNSRGG